MVPSPTITTSSHPEAHCPPRWLLAPERSMAPTYVSEGIDAHIGCGSHCGLSYIARVQTGAPGGIIDAERAGETESEEGRQLTDWAWSRTGDA